MNGTSGKESIIGTKYLIFWKDIPNNSWYFIVKLLLWQVILDWKLKMETLNIAKKACEKLPQNLKYFQKNLEILPKHLIFGQKIWNKMET